MGRRVRQGHPGSRNRKNILLVVVDCARSEKTVVDLPQASPFTRRSARLPFIDRLRELGTTWTHLNAVSSTTTPSIASMLTGLLPVHHGIREHSRHALRIGVPTAVELLRRDGYHTYAEVTGPLIREVGLARGFERYRCRDREEYLHTGLLSELEPLLDRLREPWFLCLHLWEAHQPYQNPWPFDSMESGYTPYDRSLSLIDECLLRLFGDHDLRRTSLVYTADHGERLAEDYDHHRELGGGDAAILDAHRAFVDAHPGPLDFDAWFAEAERLFGEVTARMYAHSVLGHGFHLTEDQIRVPLVIVDPDRCAAGEVRDDLRSQLDLGATLLDLAGVQPGGDDRLGGRSLLERGSDAMLYIEANGSGGKQLASRCYLRGARDRRWKYWRVEAGQLKHRVLWDLAGDPRETRDVAAEHPAICERLDRFIDERLREPYAPRPDEVDASAGDAIERRLQELGYL